MIEGGQAKTSGDFEGSSQFHCLTDLHPDKYSSCLGVKNVRCVSKVMEVKVAETNAPWGAEINVSKN